MTALIYVHEDEWDGPDDLDPSWVVWNAPRPLYGEREWQGAFRAGVFYAAAPEGATVGGRRYSDLNEALDARIIQLVDNDAVLTMLKERLARDGYTVEDYKAVGMTVGDTAVEHGLPWVDK